MSSMFKGAKSFNRDITTWKVSKVISLKDMFRDARSFNRNLCGSSWVKSKATKTGMFIGSSGSISNQACPDNRPLSRPICTSTRPTLEKSAESAGSVERFKISSNEQLKIEIAEYLHRSERGDCSDCPQGAIGDWDVSRVTDMSNLFYDANMFNGDLSKWDVSSVTNMKQMFMGASSFDRDLTDWDVSKVVDMTSMFANAKAFNSDISTWDVSKVEIMTAMFSGAEAFDAYDCKVNWGVSVR